MKKEEKRSVTTKSAKSVDAEKPVRIKKGTDYATVEIATIIIRRGNKDYTKTRESRLELKSRIDDAMKIQAEKARLRKENAQKRAEEGDVKDKPDKRRKIKQDAAESGKEGDKYTAKRAHNSKGDSKGGKKSDKGDKKTDNVEKKGDKKDDKKAPKNDDKSVRAQSRDNKPKDDNAGKGKDTKNSTKGGASKK